MSRRAAIYARISQDREGAGLGIDRQVADCRALAERLGWTVAEVYSDNDLSAWQGKARPGYRDLLEAMKGGQIDGVLVWHTDRLHRSPRELEDYLDVVDAAATPIQHETVRAGRLDLNTGTGQMVARITGATARHESDMKSERITRKHQQSAEQGKWRGGARPFGYMSDARTLNPPEAALIRQAYRDLLAGASQRSVLKAWNASGITSVSGKPWSYQTMRQVLLRPRNYGASIYRGEVVGTGDWEPLVDEATWRGVHALLTDPARKGKSTNRARWLLSGVALCGVCGDTVKIGTGGSRDGKSWPIYTCRSGSHLGRRAEYVDNHVAATVIERLSQPDARDLLLAEQPDTEGATMEAQALRAQIAEAVSLYGEGVLSAAELRATKGRLEERLAAAEARLLDGRRRSVLEDAIGEDAEDRWLSLPVDRQRAIVRELLDVRLLKVEPGRQRRFHEDTVEIVFKGLATEP